MARFTLPSGRVVETHEPTFGEYLDVVDAYNGDFKALAYAKFAVIVPELSKEEVANLAFKDGRALLVEISRIWEGRTEEATIPLNNGGPKLSTDSSLNSATAKLPSD